MLHNGIVTMVMTAAQLSRLLYVDYPDWASEVSFSDMTMVVGTEYERGRRRQYRECSVNALHRGLGDPVTISARTPQGLANRLDRQFAAWDKQWRVAKRLGSPGAVKTAQRGESRGSMYVQVVYIDDERDAAEIDVSATIRHNGLRKPHRGERNLQRAYVYRWPFQNKPERGHLVIGTSTLALVTRLSKSGSNYNGYTVELDAFLSLNALTLNADELVDLVQKYPRGSLDDTYYSARL